MLGGIKKFNMFGWTKYFGWASRFNVFSWSRHVGLSWKVQIAPVFLIISLVGLGMYSLKTLQSNQTAADNLMSGPVRQAELMIDLTSMIWSAHANLYRLTATAASETDAKAIEGYAFDATASLGRVNDSLSALEISLCGPGAAGAGGGGAGRGGAGGGGAGGGGGGGEKT